MDIRIDPLWVSILVTCVLVIITGLYLRETRKIRLESIRPIFSLRTGLYTVGGGMHWLFLRNIGGVARDLEIDIETSTSENGKFFVPSLNSGQEVNLNVEFQKIRESNGFVNVKLKFKNGRDQKLTDSLSVDFRRLSKEGRQITFQLSPMDEHLEEIARSLQRIETKS